ncbi:toll/interleukin-1 receptor domain-containing protein [Bradyrhizobium ontarionense]|uniref:Toll/interleukin-1 receptor domain-containing protein n=1 Tax=Bradyrhizobium ontarionense TaxID=2898149 RepID=A0ABY3REL3_9BRAD|nr:toll/interleukin-1 receptor domain-containing protein [Bradyrhizobium sp. A19]UFZ05400.1 toll/interleukin-1 receptor domain-containing protein [Bradyrhizobium sp. A19]
MAKAFISYSHRDERALERLHTHLATMTREGTISTWYDREILAGGEIDHEIASSFAKSDLFLALVSPDFLASRYCYEQEMKSALERHADGTMRVVPVILEPCDWRSTPLGKLKAIPKDGRAISTWTNENVAYLDVVTELRRITAEQQTSKSEEPLPKIQGERARAETRTYRIKKKFDSIDRDDFRRESFAKIQQFFHASVDELNQVSELIRARFEKINELAFTCTALNKANNREANITLRADTELFASNIAFSFSRRAAPGTANGFVHIDADDYELYLRLDDFSRGQAQGDKAATAEEVADALWRKFTSNAGIDHE